MPRWLGVSDVRVDRFGGGGPDHRALICAIRKPLMPSFSITGQLALAHKGMLCGSVDSIDAARDVACEVIQ